jgi:hypothetical protein
MKNIYVILIPIWFLAFTTFIIINERCSWVSSDTTNLIMGGIAMLVSIISLAIADRKKPFFKGEIHFWVVAGNSKFLEVEENMHSEYTELSIKVINKAKNAIDELLVSFRLPSNFYLKSDDEKNGYQYFRFKESLILTSDKVRFLGNKTGDNNITFEHFLRVHKMGENRKVYITISGQNISPTTTSLTKKQIVELSNYNSEKPFILKT